MPDELVTIFETNDQIEVILCKEMLEETGLRVMQIALRDPGLLQIPTEMLTPRFRLQVFAQDAAQAREIVEEFRREAVNNAQLQPDTPPAPDEDAKAESGMSRAGWAVLLLICAILVALLLCMRLGGLRGLLGW